MYDLISLQGLIAHLRGEWFSRAVERDGMAGGDRHAGEIIRWRR
jgi:hypothetical protein